MAPEDQLAASFDFDPGWDTYHHDSAGTIPTSGHYDLDIDLFHDLDIFNFNQADLTVASDQLHASPSQFGPPPHHYGQVASNSTFSPRLQHGQSAPNSQSATSGSDPTSSRPETPSLALASPVTAQVPPKVGTRFSKESLRVLRTWLAAHSRRPFPSDEERQMLQRQTGLTKTQILNWLANARRRGKIPDHRTASPRTHSPSTKPLDIPVRPGTPAPHDRTPFMNMNPLERWVDSPPEHEPATATAIARAVASTSPFQDEDHCDNNNNGNNTPADTASGSSRYRPSPSSSVGTSRSSSGSGYSFESRDSAGSLSLFTRHRLRRKRRGMKHRGGEKTPLTTPTSTFQCTFCTESFSTKHTWQRHEKSLHLALERWVCAPHGPRSANPDGALSCVFCGAIAPDDAHIESHNYMACQERSLEERTFHRKDHLGQHLRLVHNLRPDDLGQQLRAWKMDTPEIRSLCGFCGITMNTWAARTDHLAEHFKMGSTMADWKGDWGFDDSILARVENAVAPYLISHERTSPFPFTASQAPLESPRNAYELIKLELMNFVDICYDRTGKIPTSEEMQFDACRIIFAAEIPSYRGGAECSSWLRDLIMSADHIMQRAKLSPLRSATESKLAFLGIIGKNNPFESCPCEMMLQDFVRASGDGATLSDDELRQEACRIIQHMESESSSPSDIPATWLREMARCSTSWLGSFRQRANMAPAEDCRSIPPPSATDSSTIDSILQNYNELESRLSEHLETLRSHGIEPDDANLRQQALRIISEFDCHEWKEAAAKNHSWVARFKRRHLPWSSVYTAPEAAGTASFHAFSGRQTSQPFAQHRGPSQGAALHDPAEPTSLNRPAIVNMKTGLYFLNDPNFDRWVARELARWVAATMSPHNPNQHIPTDEELQHQGRWIMYEDGDPFNQTAADNAEWLRRFKRDVGILKDVGPGLHSGELLGTLQSDTRGLDEYAGN